MGKSIGREDALRAIKDAANAGRLIPFVGAGFSANIKGYPSWKESVKLLKKRIPGCGFFSDSDDFLEAYQYAYWYKGGDQADVYKRLASGKNQLFDGFLGQTLMKPLKELEDRRIKTGIDVLKTDLRQHDLLTEFFNKIYTTNWDTLIEYTCKIKRREYGSYFAQIGEYSYGSKYRLNQDISTEVDKVKIIKYHGSIEDKTCTSIVASTADYHERISSLYVHPLDQELYWDMRENVIMFIGYSLSDINIKYVMNQVLFEAWRQKDVPYKSQFYLIDLACKKNPSESVVDYWRKCCEFTTVYLFEKDHVYNDLERIIQDWEQECGNKHNNCKRSHKPSFTKRLMECKTAIKDLGNVGKRKFIPILDPSSYIVEVEEIINKIDNRGIRVIPKEERESIKFELYGLINKMRKEAITNFLEYIKPKRK